MGRGIEYVGSAVKSKGHDVRLFQQRTESNEELTNEILDFEPDLVGFSAMTYAFPDGLEIARRIKQKNPDVYTVFGGYHASSTPEIVQYDSIDFTVIGEGENTLVPKQARFFSVRRRRGSDFSGTHCPRSGRLVA